MNVKVLAILFAAVIVAAPLPLSVVHAQTTNTVTYSPTYYYGPGGATVSTPPILIDSVEYYYTPSSGGTTLDSIVVTYQLNAQLNESVVWCGYDFAGGPFGGNILGCDESPIIFDAALGTTAPFAFGQWFAFDILIETSSCQTYAAGFDATFLNSDVPIMQGTFGNYSVYETTLPPLDCQVIDQNALGPIQKSLTDISTELNSINENIASLTGTVQSGFSSIEGVLGSFANTISDARANGTADTATIISQVQEVQSKLDGIASVMATSLAPIQTLLFMIITLGVVLVILQAVSLRRKHRDEKP